MQAERRRKGNVVMDISGQRVMVIGGTSGIGLATARAAAERGAQVVVVSARHASVQRALEQLPDGTTGHIVDVRDAAALDAVFARIGALDHLVYTSGEALTLTPNLRERLVVLVGTQLHPGQLAIGGCRTIHHQVTTIDRDGCAPVRPEHSVECHISNTHMWPRQSFDAQ
jgi:D-arabinose 1-dehydrogenase-like Zn-dependent alcohol dehydrogenase